MLEGIIRITIASLLPVLASAIFALIEKKHPVSTKKQYITEQIVIGVVFGGLAVLGTEWGIPLNGAMINCRDGAVLCAGLIFGGPAGIIAGLIGGIERWVAVAWGVGSFTRVACSVSTALAGFYAAACRKYLFGNKRTIWSIACGCGIVMEIFHLSMIFVTNIHETTKALAVVQGCTIPMVISNSCAVMLGTVVVSAIYGERLDFITGRHTPLAATVQRLLFLCVVVVFMISTIFVRVLQDAIAMNDLEVTMMQAMDDITADINKASDAHLIDLAKLVAADINNGEDNLHVLAEKYGVTEINVVGSSALITNSTNPDFIQFDMKKGGQSEEFLCLLHGAKEYAQPYGPIAYDEETLMKYVGVPLTYGFVQLGVDAKGFQADIDAQIVRAAANRHVGQTGVLFIADDQNIVVSGPVEYVGRGLMGTHLYEGLKTYHPGEIFKAEVLGQENFCMYSKTEGYSIIAVEETSEALHHKNTAVYITDFLLIIMFALFFALMSVFFKRRVVDKVNIVNEKLTDITNGKLDTVLDVYSNEEFTVLSKGINTTVDALKGYIKEAEERIAADLEMAKNIQSSVLPDTFPAYPNRSDFEVYALMDPAKEVGGDFYDFYLTSEETFNFIVADVSGKGIPAALFMMRAKTQLKSLTEGGLPLNEVFTRGNNGLCEGNAAGMFVTAWQGQINLETGMLTLVNAGHNPPLIRHADGQFEYLRMRCGMVLAGMEDVPYKQHEIQLNPGDTIFLYTDGVTEATDANIELYGEDRLVNCLNTLEYDDMQQLCDKTKAKVDEFVGEAPQFDDITILAFRYNGK